MPSKAGSSLRVRRAARTVILLALVSLAQACSSSTGPMHATASTRGTGSEAGYYKIGKPYTINGVTYVPAFDPNYDETGIASWYAGEFTGEPTANGELYDPEQLTAAHRTLPLPSLVRVTNLDNGRALVVRINDRGPYANNRIIDLSRRCAQLLGFEKKGTAKVRVEILAKDSEALADAARHGELATDVASAIETNPVAGSPAAPAPVQMAANGELPVQPTPAQASSTPITATPLAPPGAPAGNNGNMPTPLADSAGGIAVVNEKAVINQETGGEAPKGQSIAGRFLPAPVVQHEPVRRTGIFIQAGAFAAPENAAKLRDRLNGSNVGGPVAQAQTVPATIGGRTLYRVRIGPLKDVAAADADLSNVIAAGATDAKIVVEQ